MTVQLAAPKAEIAMYYANSTANYRLCGRLCSKTLAIGFVFSAILGLFGTLPARAADHTFVGNSAIAMEDDVAANLGLSHDSRASLAKLIDERETAAVDLSL